MIAHLQVSAVFPGSDATNGASLIGQMLKAQIDLRGDPPIWTNAAMQDLIVEDGRVAGSLG